MEQNKTEKLVKALYEAKKKHGQAKLKQFFESLEQGGAVKTQDCREPATGCGTGYYWSETLCRCVLDVG